MTDTDRVLRYIDGKIESYNRRKLVTPAHAADFAISAHTLGILAGDLRAGLHMHDDPAQAGRNVGDELTGDMS